VETVWGGDEECEHKFGIEGESRRIRWGDRDTLSDKQASNKGSAQMIDALENSGGNFCSKCGAWKGQLGLEPNPNLYVKHLMEIFNALKKVLKPTGLFFLNIGDTYSGSGGAGGDWQEGSRAEQPKWSQGLTDLPDKCMSMIPERVMMAMVDNGWILRNKIIWNKPNPMPESVKDRFSTGYEFVYMFSLNKKYYFDLDAVRENPKTGKNYTRNASSSKRDERLHSIGQNHRTNDEDMSNNPKGKNPGDVWDITTKPFPEAHFAVYPPELCEKPIRAGCPKKVCVECGKPWERDVEEIGDSADNIVGKYAKEMKRLGRKHKSRAGGFHQRVERTFKGWKPTCDCDTDQTEPGVVLDPFLGAGTTGLKALKEGRNFIGIEISEKYVKMAKERLKPYLNQKRLVAYA